ncbi:glycine zipper family protein [Paraburkholderia dioscoreae]|nr:glycine zipper family protein [Paraburkholderia dioscoreae]
MANCQATSVAGRRRCGVSLKIQSKMMTRKKHLKTAVCMTVATGLLFVGFSANAQESANDDLNSCVKHEQIVSTAKGVGIGALTGLTAMLVSHKKDDAVKGALIGAAVGGVAGFATAYYTAVNTCFKKNPAWLPESDIQRTKDYDNVKRAIKYKPAQGIITRAESVEVGGTVKADGQANVSSSFILMTPDGAEAPVTIERKLYSVSDDKETEVPFPGRTSEQHTFEPGEQKDTVHIPIPHDAKAGSVYRVQFSVAAADRPPSVASQTFTVKE